MILAQDFNDTIHRNVPLIIICLNAFRREFFEDIYLASDKKASIYEASVLYCLQHFTSVIYNSLLMCLHYEQREVRIVYILKLPNSDKKYYTWAYLSCGSGHTVVLPCYIVIRINHHQHTATNPAKFVFH